MHKILDNTKRVATLRKRRNGIFKKALELWRLTGADLSLTVLHKHQKFTFKTPNFDSVSIKAQEFSIYNTNGAFTKGENASSDCDDGIFIDQDMDSNEITATEESFSEQRIEAYLRALMKEYAEQRMKQNKSTDSDEGFADPDFIPTPTFPNAFEFQEENTDLLDAAFDRVIEKLKANETACDYFTALAEFKNRRKLRPLNAVKPQVRKLENAPFSPPMPSCSDPELDFTLDQDYFYPQSTTLADPLDPIFYETFTAAQQLELLPRPTELLLHEPSLSAVAVDPSPLTEALEVIQELQGHQSEGSTTLTELLAE
ncbi:hypothetical protein Ciccas_013430 [Cichlidogyrus casuarinus]|uniref:MADS-box domain-containing protein n=1 Tax=Cichlidogyrus casuarinus TaxID=1844966 RepID=A0ABD2PL45_9PLAT